MKASSGTLFPLLVLAILAALSFWLEQASEVPLIKNDGNTRHDPDTLVDNLTLFRHDQTGALKYKLVATHMEHYPDDDSSLVLKPFLTSYRPDAPEVHLTGQRAIVTKKGEQVRVIDDVVVTRAAFADREEMIARTSELTILPEEGKAFNDLPVHITQGKSWMKGVGTRVDNNLGTFSLESQVTGEYFQKKALPTDKGAPASTP